MAAKGEFLPELSWNLAYVGAETAAGSALWLFLHFLSLDRSGDLTSFPIIAGILAFLVGEFKTPSTAHTIIRPVLVCLNLIGAMKLTTGHLTPVETAVFVGGFALLNAVGIAAAHSFGQEIQPPDNSGKPPQLPPGANP